ncbi:hypothetical protein Shyhy01_74170 [Streptomyces hygroscopicus subsp. hygroscopicus]|uniref:hypothetical protein n=1 Tax=Streptomyces sp. KHY 26 TaxID=3097359 RepID=UPI0024A3AAF7|nr:hypothetical protein [Streptomyces hygroscopicus]GLX54468.1 hypothetical protein Shyhy01_74170 [Streptomyces hygroscopicus subsp. hygroscopicus]
MTEKVTELGEALRALGERGEHLIALQPAPEDLDEIRDEMDAARRLLVVARASLARRCPQHPNAPVDPAADGECLFCATNRRRGETGGVTEAVPLHTVARAVAELGQDEAVRRYGAQTVTRAPLRCRNDIGLLQESA